MATQVPVFFGKEWAEDVRLAVEAGPSEQVLAGKLPTYWDWIASARAEYGASWALGCRDLPAELGGGPSYLVLEWEDGHCVRSRIVGPDDPLEATYVFGADYAVWRELLAGEDPGRIVMYRRLRLEEGNVVTFFRGIYFFVEAVAAATRVPAALPDA
ncbi:MAG: hypothetical protein GEV11_11475 [Streptosporangiales bacterium]|nr:hypothetical protein [Streptosporangiales bacterium]